MTISEEIQEQVEEHIKLMISQLESYIPFIKVAFPYSNNIADACYSMIVGSALSVFVNQYALRMKFPTVDDYTEFGKFVQKYRDEIDQFFK